MNLAQLELKRLKSLLGGVRKARHLAQAMRAPLAKYLSFERRAQRAWNRANEQLQFVREYGAFENFESNSKERIEALDAFAQQLADNEKTVLKAIAKLEGSKRLHAPSLPIEERIAKRKKKSKVEERKAIRKKAAWEALQKNADSAFENWVAQMPSVQAREALLSLRRMLRANTLYDTGRELSLVRAYGTNEIADQVKAYIEQARKLSNS